MGEAVLVPLILLAAVPEAEPVPEGVADPVDVIVPVGEDVAVFEAVWVGVAVLDAVPVLVAVPLPEGSATGASPSPLYKVLVQDASSRVAIPEVPTSVES